MTKGFIGLVGVVVSAFILLFATGASAATLVGDYQLQGTLASSGTGPALTNIGSGTNEFQNDNVMGASRQVLAFPLDNGVQISPAGVGTGPYSLVTTFRFDDQSGYSKILDPVNGTDDSGLYADGGYVFYTKNPAPHYQITSDASNVFANNVYATTVVVVTPPSETKVYVNGTLQLTAANGLTPLNDTLRLFKDDTSEDSAGAVSCIRLYSGGLSPADAAGIGASPTCGTVSTPTTPKKKCKKHKKKHRAADAKKKKCKKKR